MPRRRRVAASIACGGKEEINFAAAFCSAIFVSFVGTRKSPALATCGALIRVREAIVLKISSWPMAIKVYFGYCCTSYNC